MVNQQQKPYNVILIGDHCRDEYQYGSVDRLSPEAPIPVFCPLDTTAKDGMAGNVANNLRNLGIDVRYYHGSTSVKIRMIDHKSKQHLLRVDHDVKSSAVKFADLDLSGIDAVVVSDYGKGTVDYSLIEDLQAKTTLPIFLDTKKTDLAKFSRCVVKINELEYSRRTSEGTNVIVTYGGSHVCWSDTNYPVPTVPVFDVCGAGDTFLAGLVYMYLCSGSMNIAIRFAIAASSVTVQHPGVYAPLMEEIVWLD